MSMLKEKTTAMKSIKINQTTVQLLLINIFIFALMSYLRPNRFLTLFNFQSMCFQFPEPALLTIGIAITMITAGADLSIVSTANLVATLNGMLLLYVMPSDASSGTVLLYLALCLLIALAIGLICGAINGILVAKLGIFPILATLGTMNLFTGISTILTKGQGVFGAFPDELVFVGSGMLFGFLPVPLVIFMVILALVYLLIHKTPYGLKTQWFGSNRRASFYSGIDNVKTVFRTYMFSALLGAFTGFLILARTNSAKADYGMAYVMQALLASVLGGVSPLGGKGNIFNFFLAIVALQFLDSGFNFLRISSFIRSSTYGALLIIGVFLEYVYNQRQQKKMVKRAQEAATKAS